MYNVNSNIEYLEEYDNEKGKIEDSIEDIDLAIEMGERSYLNAMEISKIHLELRQYDLYKRALMNLTKINQALFTLKKDREDMLLGCF